MQVLKEVVKEKAVPVITVNNIQDVLSSGKLPVLFQQKREAPVSYTHLTLPTKIGV